MTLNTKTLFWSNKNFIPLIQSLMTGHEGTDELQFGTTTWVSGYTLYLCAKNGGEVRLQHLLCRMHSARTELCRQGQCQDCEGGLNHLTTTNYWALTIFKVQCKAEGRKTVFHLQVDCARKFLDTADVYNMNHIFTNKQANNDHYDS